MLSETQKVIATFLSESFKPARLTFPKNVNNNYKNAIFSCTITESHDMCFFDVTIKTPYVFMAKILDTVCYEFKLVLEDDMYILDTKGLLPIRYIYMLKDFCFKETGIIDYNSDVTYEDIIKKWNDIINPCPLNILKNIALYSLNIAENQSYDITVNRGPSYFNDRTWYTKDYCTSECATEFMNRSKALYSLGNIEPYQKIKFCYEKLDAAEGGINMDYAIFQPWYNVRYHIHTNFKSNTYFCPYTDVRGHNSYHRRQCLPVEELIILYEFLKSEGADVEVIKIQSY
jgi:hypothetical protein